MKRVLVTGAGGYIGIPLCSELLQNGCAVLALDRYFFGKDKLHAISSHPNFTMLQADIRNVDPKALSDVDAIIDLAGLSNDLTGELNPLLTQDINLQGPSRLAQAAKKHGVKRYIYSSSASTYGAGVQTALDETCRLAPQTEYARCKVEMEKALLALWNPQFEVVILRNATVYGLAPRMRFDLAVNIMTKRAWRERVIYVMGGGKQWRPFVHVQDVVQAMILALNAPAEKVSGEIFNVGSDRQNYEIEHLAKLVMDLVPNVTLHHIPDDPDKRSYNVTFKKIERVLGFHAKHEVRDGIEEIHSALVQGRVDPDDPTCYTLSWYKSIMDWSERVRDLTLNGRVLEVLGE